MNNSKSMEQLLMLFYSAMAAAIVIAGIIIGDYSWFVLAAGSGCLAMSSRIKSRINEFEKNQAQLSRASMFSRVGFLFIAAGLLINAFGT